MYTLFGWLGNHVTIRMRSQKLGFSDNDNGKGVQKKKERRKEKSQTIFITLYRPWCVLKSRGKLRVGEQDVVFYNRLRRRRLGNVRRGRRRDDGEGSRDGV
jgi:hypothetical protein